MIDLVGTIAGMANSNSSRGGGSGIGPQFKSTNTKKQNKTAGLMNLIDPGNTFMGLWNKGDEEENTGYDGYKPYASITEFPLGKSLVDILTERMYGGGVGFGDDFISRSTSPEIASREARWNEQEKPFINSQLSSRNMGRSTLAADVLRRASQAKERDISEILAQRYIQNEQQKRQEINDALNQSQGVTKDEMNTRLHRANFDAGRFDFGVEQSNYQDQTDYAREQANNNMIMKAIGAGLDAYGNSGSEDDSSTNDLISMLLKNNKTNTTQKSNLGGFQQGTWL